MAKQVWQSTDGSVHASRLAAEEGDRRDAFNKVWENTFPKLAATPTMDEARDTVWKNRRAFVQAMDAGCFVVKSDERG